MTADPDAATHPAPGPVLRTARLILRPPELTDEDAVFAGMSDWEVARMLARPPWPYLRENAAQWLRMVTENTPSEDKVVFMLALKTTPAAAIGAAGVERRHPGEDFQLGFWLAREHWGKGLMTEAAAEVVRFGFQTLGLKRIESGCLSDNPASGRVHLKLGFKTLGRSMIQCVPRGAEAEHIDLLLERADWEARR